MVDQYQVADNPYVVVLNKKTRALKKKLEKIRKTETFAASGRTLNEEQKVLLAGKSNLECLLREHDRIRSLLEGVAKAEFAAKAEKAPAPSQPGDVSALSIPADPAPKEEPLPHAEPTASVACAATETEPPEVTEVAIQTDMSGPSAPPCPGPGEGMVEATAAEAAATVAAAAAATEAREAAEMAASEARREELIAGVGKLLRLLHVASRFEAKGERLPSEVDFFSKV
ncbi:unnamed protein product, partial [Discosporangium mesarthrocarpum]